MKIKFLFLSLLLMLTVTTSSMSKNNSDYTFKKIFTMILMKRYGSLKDSKIYFCKGNVYNIRSVKLVESV